MGVEPHGDHAEIWRVQQFNEGCALWVYDEAHIWQIRGEGVDVCTDEDSVDATQRVVLDGWGRAGMLRICELDQDDSLDLLVFLGRLPEASELRELGRWYPPQAARLALPSGKLCLEGANALRLAGDEVPGEPTAVVEVPPGDYRMSLFNMDFDQLEDDCPDWGKDGSAPWQILALTELDEAAEDLEDSPFLPWTPSLQRPQWLGDFRIDDGVFYGLYNAPDSWDTLHINLDAAAAASLALAEGDVLSVTTDLGEIRALFRGAAPPLLGKPDPDQLARLEGFPEAAGASMFNELGHGLMLSLVRWATADQRYDKRAAWQPVMVRKL